ncbi:MAG: TetR/AcrR family transcriptional regulator [Actinomycetota bacterium]
MNEHESHKRRRFAHARNRPQQRRSAATFEAVVAAADQVFGDVGVDRARVADIAGVAGVSVGAVYHLFPDKAAIGRAIGDRYLEQAGWIYIDASAELRTVADVPVFVAAVVNGLAALHDEHPGFFAVARWVDPGDNRSPADHVRQVQIEGLADLFAPLAPDVDRVDAELVAANCVDIARSLLERLPPAGEERDRFLAEFQALVVAYLGLRLPGLAAPERVEQPPD